MSAHIDAPEWVLSLSCPDRTGIVHAVTGALLSLDATITESQQYGSPDSQRFFLRMQFRTEAGRERILAALAPAEEDLGLDISLFEVGRKMPTVIMVSKAGHCLNDLLFRHRNGTLPLDIVAIVSNHEVLEPLARFYSVPFHHIPVTPDTKAEAEARLDDLVERSGTELVVLARYMQVLSDQFTERMAGRLINIHHSSLPSFKGAKPYHQAYARGVKIIGATAHYVTADLDEGPIIEQDVSPVGHERTIKDLVNIGQGNEARVLSTAVQWHAEGRVLLDGHRTVVFS